MGTKKIQYKIDHPCHEDWNAMTPEKQGRFCNACQKEVIDFSTMLPSQVIRTMQMKSTEKVCGRFKKSQLDQVYALPRTSAPWSVDLRAVILGFALTTFIPEQSIAQGKVVKELQDTNRVEEPILMGDIAPQYVHKNEKVASGKIESDSSVDRTKIRVTLYDVAGKEIAFTYPNQAGVFNFPLDWTKNPAYVQISATFIATDASYFEYERDLERILFYVINEREMIKGEIEQVRQ
jgi:hypothetical protein